MGGVEVTTVLHAGEGEQVGGATAVTIKAGGEQTGGTFYLGEVVAQPDFPGPPRHVHQRLHDAFYVLDGTLTVQIGDETVELAPGGFACVPPGVAHTFSNRTQASVRFLNFNTPSGWEHYMRDLDTALANGAATQAEIGQIAARYDFRLA
jgi:mannose-6-phosphate isomerase-like protein (cupin superfamily)